MGECTLKIVQGGTSQSARLARTTLTVQRKKMYLLVFNVCPTPTPTPTQKKNFLSFIEGFSKLFKISNTHILVHFHVC